jgi:O-antigen ligase
MTAHALTARGARARTVLGVGAGVGASLAAGLAAGAAPFAALGAFAGALLLLVVLVQPLALIGFMLAIGPIDLSFATGGFKGLLTEQGGLDMNGIRLIGLTIGLTAVALIDPRVMRAAFSRYGRWYLVFLAYAAATLAQSTAVIDGLRLLLKIAYPFLVFIAVRGVARTPEDVNRLVDWTLAGAAVIALLLNPLYVIAGGYEYDLDGRLRIQGVGVHQNPFSFYLLMMILLAFARFAVRGRKLYLGLCGVLALWMALTLTRITMLAAVVGLGGIALMAALRSGSRRALWASALLGSGVLLALLPVVLERTLGYVPTPGQLLALAGDPAALYRAMNWQGRELLWPVILQALMSSPLTGLGLGSTGPLLRGLFPAEIGLVAHNEYLRLAAETGIVGVTLFFVAVMHWLAGAVKAGRSTHPIVRELAWPAVAGILAWSVIAITDNAFDYYAQFTQYIALCCGGALAAWSMESEATGDADIT